MYIHTYMHKHTCTYMYMYRPVWKHCLKQTSQDRTISKPLILCQNQKQAATLNSINPKAQAGPSSSCSGRRGSPSIGRRRKSPTSSLGKKAKFCFVVR